MVVGLHNCFCCKEKTYQFVFTIHYSLFTIHYFLNFLMAPDAKTAYSLEGEAEAPVHPPAEAPVQPPAEPPGVKLPKQPLDQPLDQEQQAELEEKERLRLQQLAEQEKQDRLHLIKQYKELREPININTPQSYFGLNCAEIERLQKKREEERQKLHVEAYHLLFRRNDPTKEK